MNTDHPYKNNKKAISSTIVRWLFYNGRFYNLNPVLLLKRLSITWLSTRVIPLTE